MNSYQAKRIPLAGILERLGHHPHHEAGGELWYFSPFREETTPSFKINPKRNIWYDFGEGKGGNVLDFVLTYYQLGTISEALRHLEDLGGNDIAPPVVTFEAFPTGESAGSDVSITKVQPLRNYALRGYLNERGIATATARPWVREIYYTRNDKPYFALAFPNESGGYELRNRYYKGTTGSKDISIVKPEGAASGPVCVFEGFMDFLSALTWYGPDPATGGLPGPVIVLNGAAMRDRAVAAIREMGAEQVTLYLDRDEAGHALFSSFQQQLSDLEVIDGSGLYAGYKDFNAFLVHRQRGESRARG